MPLTSSPPPPPPLLPAATLAYNSRFRHSLKPDSEDEDWGPNWYSFDYGPVHVIFLSSEHSKYENDIAQQAHWLEQNLQVRTDAWPPQRQRGGPTPRPHLHLPLLLLLWSPGALMRPAAPPARCLQKANRAQQRLKVPWIVVVLHRPLHNNPPAGGYAGGIRCAPARPVHLQQPILVPMSPF